MIVLKSEVILRAYKKRGEAGRFPGVGGWHQLQIFTEAAR
jgi:hypothetical protein